MKKTFLTLLSLILALSATGQAKFETFIPAGWREISRDDGDVNGDSQMNYDISKDRALIIEKIDVGSQSLRQTSLLVLLGTTTRESFTLYCNSDLAAPDQSAAGFSYRENGLKIDRGMLAVEFSYVAPDGTNVMHTNVYKLVNKQVRLIMSYQMGVSKDFLYTVSHDMVDGKLMVERMELPSKKSIYKTESILKVESLPELCTHNGSETANEFYLLSKPK